jgi:predicted aldo/keto reductase-like oxidoreductase
MGNSAYYMGNSAKQITKFQYGLGTIRLPTIGSDYSQIDEQKAVQIVRYAIDCRVNYIDTAYPYHKV